MSNSLNPDQTQHFVGSDLGPNCLQRLPERDTISAVIIDRTKILGASSKILQIRKFSREFNFRETSHVRNFVKIKPSRIGDVTLSFTIRENKILAEFTVEAPNPSLIECTRDGPLHISRGHRS